MGGVGGKGAAGVAGSPSAALAPAVAVRGRRHSSCLLAGPCCSYSTASGTEQTMLVSPDSGQGAAGGADAAVTDWDAQKRSNRLPHSPARSASGPSAAATAPCSPFKQGERGSREWGVKGVRG